MGKIQNRYADLFKNELGKVTGITAKLNLEPDAQHKFHQACPVVFAVRDLVEKEIIHQVQNGIFKPADFLIGLHLLNQFKEREIYLTL